MKKKLKSIQSFVASYLESTPSSTTCVLVTSGGTRSAIEKSAVRFIDNFSSGKRGALVVEELLEYQDSSPLVLMLARKGSLLPYERRWNDDFTYEEHLEVLSGRKKIKVLDKKQLSNVKRLHITFFEDVEEYLYLLRRMAELLEKSYTRLLIYLIAAVSDFYVPLDLRPTHKLRSDGGQLLLSLASTPKCIYSLKNLWTRKAIVVSFKLETDESIMLDRAEDSLRSNGVDLVIGNILSTRYNTVTLLGRGFIEEKESRSKHLMKIVLSGNEEASGVPIEKALVRESLKYLRIVL